MTPKSARIAQATLGDIDSVAALRHALWPDVPLDDLFEESQSLIDDQGANAAVFLAFIHGAAVAVGLAEVVLRRDYVNGCETSPVAFLEGVYVAPGHRRMGIARALVAKAADWGRAVGASEFASDARLDNEASHAFHRAAGFEETDRVVYFRRAISERDA